MHKLVEIEVGSFIIDYPAEFRANGYLSIDDISDSFEFAYDMTFGNIGKHRDHRSGGTHKRHNGELFSDTMQGKLSEFVVYNVFRNRIKEINRPDLNRYGLKKWDDCDFKINQRTIAVKSTKFYGNLLLLESNDWNERGQYIPNIQNGEKNYDFFILIRIKPDLTRIMKQNKAYYSDEINKNTLEEIIFKEEWISNIVGYITHDDLIETIQEKNLIKKGSILNYNTVMDADNYYVQAGDFRPMHELLVIIDRENK